MPADTNDCTCEATCCCPKDERPADTPMVLVPRSTTSKMRAAGAAAAYPVRLGPAGAARVYDAMLSASPARGGMGASASPIPTEQTGGAVVGDTRLGESDLFEIADILRTARGVKQVRGRDYEVAEQVADYVNQRLALRPNAPSTTSTAEQVGAGIAIDDATRDAARRAGKRLNDWINDALHKAAEHAAPSPGEGDAPVAWRSMSTAPRDGTYLLAMVAGADGRWEHLNGRVFVIRHEGRTASDFDLGWSVYPGLGGASDHWFSGWQPLPDTRPTPATPEGLRELDDACCNLVNGWNDPYEPREQWEAEADRHVQALREAWLAARAALQPQAQGGE